MYTRNEFFKKFLINIITNKLEINLQIGVYFIVNI
jgi:hypothetical protein